MRTRTAQQLSGQVWQVIHPEVVGHDLRLLPPLGEHCRQLILLLANPIRWCSGHIHSLGDHENLPTVLSVYGIADFADCNAEDSLLHITAEDGRQIAAL